MCLASVSHCPPSNENLFLFAPSTLLKMKVFALVLCLAAAATARMAYQFSNGYLDVLGAEPVQNFDCTGRPYGYYADVGTDCKVFHVCLPVTDDAGEVSEIAHFSFFCNNETRFDQEALACNHEDSAFPCQEAETLYQLSNADFGKITEGSIDAILGGTSNVVFPSPGRARSELISSDDAEEPSSDADVVVEAVAAPVEIPSAVVLDADTGPETEDFTEAVDVTE